MEFWRFIFSSFWVWLGFIILTGAAGGVLVELAKACKRNRKVVGYRIDQRWHIEIDGASGEDVKRILDDMLGAEAEDKA